MSTSVLGSLEKTASRVVQQLQQTHSGGGESWSPEEDNPYGAPQAAALLSRGHFERALRLLHLRPPGHDDDGDVGPLVSAAALQQGERGAAEAELLRLLRSSGPGRGFSRTRYVQDARQLSRWRLLAGQKRDASLRLEQQMHLERARYVAIKDEYRRCVAAVEAYLGAEHEASMRLLGHADAQQRLTRELSQRRDELSRRVGQARLDVYRWEEAWRTVKACQRFLLRVLSKSPDQLRHHRSDDPALWHLDGGGNDDDDAGPGSPLPLETVPELQSADGSQASLSRDTIAEETSLEALVAAFEREASRLERRSGEHRRLVLPSEMGLRSADDLLRRFRDIEEQNLNALIHLESLGGPMAEMIGRIEEAEGEVKREIDDVLGVIRSLEVAIEREEGRAERLEGRSRELVQQAFRGLVCSERALQARVLLDDAYDSCLGANEAQLGPLGMARALESRYERLSAELDALPRPVVLAAERHGFRQQLLDAHEFKDALDKYELMQRLIAALRRLMEPREPSRRKLVYRSKPPSRRGKLDHGQDAPAGEAGQASAAGADPSARLEASAEQLDLFSKPCAEQADPDDVPAN